jgi:hypothetical protein
VGHQYEKKRQNVKIHKMRIINNMRELPIEIAMPKIEKNIK